MIGPAIKPNIQASDFFGAISRFYIRRPISVSGSKYCVVHNRLAMSAMKNIEIIDNMMRDTHSCMKLSSLSDCERCLLLNKMRSISRMFEVSDTSASDFLDGVDSQIMRSKLITLIMGLRHRAIMIGYRNVSDILARPSNGQQGALSLDDVKRIVTQSEELVRKIIARNQFTVH